jgi:hypothetical protein
MSEDRRQNTEYRRNPANGLTGQRANGQAMIELAVFGSLFLLLMGALLSYGLRFNYQQKAQMTAFRRALKIASDQERGSGSAMIMEERSIPDPMSLFGVGSTQTIAASASVVRDPHMNAQAVNKESYMGTVMDIQTKKDGTTGEEQWMRRVYQAAGFRIEYNVPEANIAKYETIYGTIRAKKGNKFVNIKDDDVDKTCLEYGPSSTDSEGVVTSGACIKANFVAIRIPDTCSGEIVDFDSCYAQSRMLVDTAFCIKKCNRAKPFDSDMKCDEVCAKLMTPPNQKVRTYNPDRGGAWYAADWYCINKKTGGTCKGIPDAEREYVFPYLNKMFGIDASNVVKPPIPPAMGIQQDAVSESIRSESMQITETPQDITTDESVAWSDITNRTLMRQDNLGPKGYENTHNTPDEFINIVVDNVQTEMSGSSDQAVQTDK